VLFRSCLKKEAELLLSQGFGKGANPSNTLIFEKNKPVKNQISRDIMLTYIAATKKVFEEFVHDEMYEWSQERWTSEVENRITKILNITNHELSINSIPDTAITGFNLWINDYLDLLLDNIHRIGTSTAYQDNSARTFTLYFAVNISIASAILDAEKSFQYLDWNVSGKYYKDKLIED
jgi:hypothetical protein